MMTVVTNPAKRAGLDNLTRNRRHPYLRKQFFYREEELLTAGFLLITEDGHILNMALISGFFASEYADSNICIIIDRVGSSNPILTTSSAVIYHNAVSPGRKKLFDLKSC
jgi:hypothetical protein